MTATEMEFPDILRDHYGTSNVTVEKLNVDLELWWKWMTDSEEYPGVDFDALGLKVEAACTYLLWKEGKAPQRSEPACDIPTGDFYLQ